jgi:mannose-1-phosphate guanylyltransferase
MKALILAAGFGTRLGKLTEKIPKALIKVGGTAILDHNIRKLLNAGISEILINTHYLSDQVEDFLRNQPYRELVKSVFEPSLLGTAGSVKANWDFFEGDDFVVMHGDNYFEAELKPLLEAHSNRTTGTILTMATFNTISPELCGTVLTNNGGIVTDFFEKTSETRSFRANAAIYVVSPIAKEYFLGALPPENDISLNVIPKLLGKIQEHFLLGDFIDIGSPTGLAAAEISHVRISKGV